MCVCVCACVRLNKLTLESFIIGPVSAVSLPEGNEVEMRDRETHGRAASTRGCHTAVPNGGHTGHYDVFQMDTSVCFPGNKSAKSRGRESRASPLWVEFLFVSIRHSALPGCHDVWR